MTGQEESAYRLRVASTLGKKAEEHILLSYGDETNHIDPWSLVSREAAAAALADAQLAIEFADDCFSDVFRP